MIDNYGMIWLCKRQRQASDEEATRSIHSPLYMCVRVRECVWDSARMSHTSAMMTCSTARLGVRNNLFN